MGTRDSPVHKLLDNFSATLGFFEQLVDRANMGTLPYFSRELGNKVDSGEQFGISYKGKILSQKSFWE